MTLIAGASRFSARWSYARYDWLWGKLFQNIVLLPIFFPQPVLGLALLLWFNALVLQMSWQTASSRICLDRARW